MGGGAGDRWEVLQVTGGWYGGLKGRTGNYIADSQY